jgi:hypothetical protein
MAILVARLLRISILQPLKGKFAILTIVGSEANISQDISIIEARLDAVEGVYSRINDRQEACP